MLRSSEIKPWLQVFCYIFPRRKRKEGSTRISFFSFFLSLYPRKYWGARRRAGRSRRAPSSGVSKTRHARGAPPPPRFFSKSAARARAPFLSPKSAPRARARASLLGCAFARHATPRHAVPCPSPCSCYASHCNVGLGFPNPIAAAGDCSSFFFCWPGRGANVQPNEAACVTVRSRADWQRVACSTALWGGGGGGGGVARLWRPRAGTKPIELGEASQTRRARTLCGFLLAS